MILLTIKDKTNKAEEKKILEQIVTTSEEFLQSIDSEMRFRSVFAAVSNPLFLLDKDTGAILDVNDAACSLYGYTRDEMLKLKNIDMSVEPEKTRKALKTSLTCVPVRYHKKKDGTVFPAEITASLFELNGRKLSTVSIRDITEYKQAEERVRRKSALLSAINQVFREALTCETEETLARKCLAVAEKLTGSKFGFIGEVNEAGLFDTIAISDPGWTNCKMPMKNATKLLKGMKLVSYWGRVIKTGQSQIVNNPDSDPDRIGIPAGHPAIISFLGVPLKQAGRTFGTIALANNKLGYDKSDLECMESLSIIFVESLHRKRIEASLKQSYNRLQKTLDDTMKTLASIVETKDPYTAGHQKRVAKLSVAIGKKLGLDNEKIGGIYTAALIHDIGKIMIPASILSKPSALTSLKTIQTSGRYKADLERLSDTYQQILLCISIR
ncbi:MAG: GAF domain-containing protein [Actinobacteria bacterium]|nr:GAF domain-containing protein [Actinomycetota bacterium]